MGAIAELKIVNCYIGNLVTVLADVSAYPDQTDLIQEITT
jgi:hypothetical protein